MFARSLGAASLLASITLIAGLAAIGCSSETGGSSGTPGGPVSGPEDTHCGMTVQKTDPAACKGAAGSGGGSTGSSGSGGAGTGGAAGMEGSEYGPTMNNAEADDDDCKYHVKFTSTDIHENKDVTFTVTVTSKADGKPVTGASPAIEAFLNETHPAPNSDQKATEKDEGVYDVGPVQFDAAGKWTARFHFFEECVDSDESPHSHVAFYINVP